MAIYSSDVLLNHLTSLQDAGSKSVSLGFLLGDENSNHILIEPIITSLQKIDSVDVSFALADNQTLTLSASDNSINLSFKLSF